MIFLYLFYTFFKIGLFGFGGGYAMLSLIQGEVVTRYHWINASEFTDIVAISQMTPGPIGINSATYVGYTAVLNAGYSEAFAVIGSIVATFAVVFPSFVLMIAISKFFLKYQKHPAVEAVFSGLRPAVVGLLAAAALVLMNKENFGSYKVVGYHSITFETFLSYKHLLSLQSILRPPRYSYFYLSASVLYTVRLKYGGKIQSYLLPVAEGRCPTDTWPSHVQHPPLSSCFRRENKDK